MKDKVVIITGASSGIGRALALECSRRGARLVLGSRNLEKLEELKSLIPGPVKILRTDVTRESDCKSLVDAAVQEFGQVDVMINNAGISMRALFAEVEPDVIRRIMDTNFWGTVYCSKHAFPHLLRSRGSLVGISSIVGIKGLPGRSGYAASKFAMQGLLEVIRIENLKKGLHVLIACPGFTTSNIRNIALSKDGSSQGESPLDESKLMSAEDAARKIARAIVLRKRTLTLTAEGKLTVFLDKFVPSLMDRIIYNHMAKEPNSPLE
jgi:NAD(P)-dependent dehydrogenase (short-subunit alcohol dehydrogenase family)